MTVVPITNIVTTSIADTTNSQHTYAQAAYCTQATPVVHTVIAVGGLLLSRAECSGLHAEF